MNLHSELDNDVVKALVESSMGYAELRVAVSRRATAGMDDTVTDCFNNILDWIPSINDAGVANIRKEVVNAVSKTANLMLDQIDLLQNGVFSWGNDSPVGIIRSAVHRHDANQELILKEYWDRV